jgi:MFS-type transporter involved in bile tolerance (Atg22 family)
MNTQNTVESVSKKSLFGWWFFDFGYSIATVIGGIYFTKWFTENLNANSRLLNSLFLTSALFIILVGKYIGRQIDLKGFKFWIILSSILSFLSILLLFLGSQFLAPSILIPFTFILFVIFLFGYQVGRICHNVYLRKVIPEKSQSKMSGYGVAANWGGSIIGIILTIPIVSSHSISVMHSREFTFLIAAIAYGIIAPISLYLMLLSKEPYDKLVIPNNPKVQFFRSFIKYIGLYFIIYFLLYDVMTIVQRNLPSFLSEVFKMADNTQAIGFLIILFSAMLGGLVAAKLIKYANSNFWLKVFSFVLALSIILITLNNSITLWTAFVTAGISYGILESAIRVNFMGTFQAKYAGENFGILAIVERASGIVGPLLWIVAFSFSSDKSQSYITSMLVMAGLAFSAFFLLFFTRKNV